MWFVYGRMRENAFARYKYFLLSSSIFSDINESFIKMNNTNECYKCCPSGSPSLRPDDRLEKINGKCSCPHPFLVESVFFSFFFGGGAGVYHVNSGARMCMDLHFFASWNPDLGKLNAGK